MRTGSRVRWVLTAITGLLASFGSASQTETPEGDISIRGTPHGRPSKTPLGFQEEESQAGGAREVRVQARAFQFDPDTISVPAGEPVRFVVTSEDMYHTFTIKKTRESPDMLLNIRVPARQTAEATHTFEERGSYYVYCIPHEGMGMTGTIEVE